MSIREISLAEVPSSHPAAIFFQFWKQAAGSLAWAPWNRFDATEHPGILPWVLLLKREADETGGGAVQWRYAVCGTGCTDLFGFSYQGKLFGEGMPAEAAKQRMVEFDRAIAGEGAQFSHTELPIPGKDFVAVYRGVFPFATEGHDVDRLFVVLASEARRIG